MNGEVDVRWLKNILLYIEEPDDIGNADIEVLPFGRPG